MLYHGTLALRSPRTRRALERMRDAIEAPVFCDVNLRDPWTPLERAHECLAAARIAKLNGEELALLTDLPCETAEDCVAAAQSLRERHTLEWVVVTRGDQGAIAVDADRHVAVDAHPPESLVDTVGAGDAFAAVLMVGLLEDWPMSTTLERAARFAAAICAIQGATTDDLLLHRSHRERWTHEEENSDVR